MKEMNRLNRLPATIADTLPLVSPWIVLIVKGVFLLIIICIIVYLYLRFGRPLIQAYRAKHTKAPSFSSNADDDASFAGLLKSIEKQYLGSKDYREGCYTVSNALKTHLEKTTGLEIEERTASEIKEILQEDKIFQFFKDIQVLKYHRKRPNQKDFLDTVERAHGISKIDHLRKKVDV